MGIVEWPVCVRDGHLCCNSGSGKRKKEKKKKKKKKLNLV